MDAMLPFDVSRDQGLASSASIPAAIVTAILDNVFLTLVGQAAPLAAADRQAATPQNGS
jgi:hypothetical protein